MGGRGAKIGSNKVDRIAVKWQMGLFVNINE